MEKIKISLDKHGKIANFVDKALKKKIKNTTFCHFRTGKPQVLLIRHRKIMNFIGQAQKM